MHDPLECDDSKCKACIMIVALEDHLNHLIDEFDKLQHPDYLNKPTTRNHLTQMVISEAKLRRQTFRLKHYEMTYNNVKYEISCSTCYEIAMKAAEDNFSDEVVTYNLEQMSVCKNIHHSKSQ